MKIHIFENRAEGGRVVKDPLQYHCAANDSRRRKNTTKLDYVNPNIFPVINPPQSSKIFGMDCIILCFRWLSQLRLARVFVMSFQENCRTYETLAALAQAGGWRS